MKPKSTLRHFLFGTAFLITASSLHAQTTYYWNQNDVAAGWGAGGAWNTSSAFFSTINDPTAAAAAATTTTLDTLNIGSATDGFAGGTLTLAAPGQSIGSIITGAANTTAAVIIDTQTLTFAATGTLTNNSSQELIIGSVIAGAATKLDLNATGGGITISTFSNTHTGITNVNSGTVTVNNNGGLGTGGTDASRTVVASGARVSFNNTPRTYTERFEIAGAGVGGSTGALANSQTSTTLNGLVTLSGAATSYSGGGALTYGGGITLGSNALTFNVAGGIQTVQTNGISGAGGSLVKTGGGTLSLSATNSYDGGTTISNGALFFVNTNAKPATGIHAFDANTTLGLGVATAGAFFIGDDITNAFAGTMTGNLSNVTVTPSTNVGIDTSAGNFIYGVSVAGSPTKALIKRGANSLTLSGDNTHTGGTSLTAGTLNINSNTAVGTGALNITGGTTLDNTSGSARTLTNNNTITATSGFTFTGSNELNLGTGAFNSSLTGNAQFGFTVNGSKLTIGGKFTTANTNGIAKNGNGTLSLLDNANAYTTFTLVNAGVLEVNKLANGGSASSIGTSNTNAANLVFASGTTLRYVGGGDSTNRAFTMTGGAGTSFTLDASGGGALNFTQTGGIAHTSGTNATRTLNFAGTNTDANTFASLIANNGSGALTVNKTGAGTWVLSRTTTSNTYTGGTAITGGILRLGTNNVLPDASNVTIGTATLDADTRTDTAGTLDVTGNAVINLGTGAALAFANSKDVTSGVWAGALNITGTFVPGNDVDPGVGVNPGSIRFGVDNTGLTASQLADISVNSSGAGTYTLDAYGYLKAGSGGTAYDTWATNNNLTGAPGFENAKDADPDKDGINNLSEFAFNGDPLSGSDNGQIHALTEDSDFDGDTIKELILTIAVRTGTPAFGGTPPLATHDGITYSIEGSLDLASFPTVVNVVPTPVVTGLPPVGDGYVYRSFSLEGSNGLSGKGFLRAKVTSP